MASVSQVDPVILGVISSIAISILIIVPLLWIFYRTHSQPTSLLWKSVYVPRTWWPEPSQRVHRVFHPLPGGSFFKFIFILLKGSTFRVIPSQKSTKHPQKENDSVFMTDEEIHLRFLALCLRLALLALILGLPTFIGLFVAGIPPSPTSLITSSVENLTVLRLLHQYDLAPTSFSSRLTVWAIFALLIGSVLAFFLVLSEWHFLRRYTQQFTREKCHDTQIVYLPCKPHSGFEKVGEKKMAKWVRACGLGPVGAEGNGIAIPSEKRRTSPTSQKAGKFYLSLKQKKNIDTLRSPDNLDSMQITTEAYQSSPASSKSEAPLSSEKRGVIIQAIFTISQLDTLNSLSEKREKVLTDLELNEAKYVAGFLPEETGFPGIKSKRSKSSKSRRKPETEDLMEEQVTPYGPLGLYKLEARPREPSGIFWEDPSLRLSRLEQDMALQILPGLPDTQSQEVKQLDFYFREIIDDAQLTNEVYQQKWNIGDEVRELDDGTFLNVARDQIPIADHGLNENMEIILREKAESMRLSSFEASTIRTSRSSRAVSLAGSWAQLGRSTPSTLASTRDTHNYPPAPSTAPTSPSLNPTDGRSTPKEDPLTLGQPAVSFSELVQQEESSTAHQNLSEDHAERQRLSVITSLAHSILSPNLSRPPKSAQSLHGNFHTNPQKADMSTCFLGGKNGYKTFSPSKSGEKSDKKVPTRSDRKPKPYKFINSAEIEKLYHSIRQNRSHLKRLNQDFLREKQKAVLEMEEGLNGSVSGWIIVGRGVGFIEGALPIDGMTRGDVIWGNLRRKNPFSSTATFWILFCVIFLMVGIIIVLVTILTMAGTLELGQYFSGFVSLQERGGIEMGLFSTTVPSIILILALLPSLPAISYLSIKFSGLPSKSSGQLLCIEAIFLLVCGCALGWFLACGNLIHSILSIKTEIGIVDRFTNSISAISNSFFAFQCILAIIVPTLILTQPKRWKKVRSALQSPQTPRQRMKSLWPPRLNSALCRGAALMGVSVLLIFSSVAPLTILPSVVFFILMVLIQRRNIYYVYRRESQSGGKIELRMVGMLSVLLALHSAFLGFILFSRQQWALATLAGGVAVFILAISALMVHQDSSLVKKRILPLQSRRALKVFEAGPGNADYESEAESPPISSKTARKKKQSLLSLFQLVESKFNSPEVQVHRPVPLLGETVDDLVDTQLALRKYPDAPPRLPFMSWGNPQAFTRWMLYPPVLLQTSPTIWLPNDGIAAEEVNDLKKYWDLDACFAEGISTNRLNLI